MEETLLLIITIILVVVFFDVVLALLALVSVFGFSLLMIGIVLGVLIACYEIIVEMYNNPPTLRGVLITMISLAVIYIFTYVLILRKPKQHKLIETEKSKEETIKEIMK